jgi:Flp pilus assembly protein TadB
MIVGDVERERAVAALREHFVRGRITIEELAGRTERVLVAATRADLQKALAGLPASLDALDLAARGRAVAHTAIRGAVLAVFTGAYLLFSIVLLLVLGITVLVHGASAVTLVAFLAVWLVPTYLLSRLWRRGPATRV